MSWLLRKVDNFLAAIIGASTGMVASQVHAFITQYLQTLGGRLNEARLSLDDMQNGLHYTVMSPEVESVFLHDARTRVVELQSAYTAIAESNLLIRPISILNNADKSIVSRTISDFVPALPFDTSSIAYMFIGIILAFILYAAAKLLVRVLISHSRRRRFRKRPGFVQT